MMQIYFYHVLDSFGFLNFLKFSTKISLNSSSALYPFPTLLGIPRNVCENCSFILCTSQYVLCILVLIFLDVLSIYLPVDQFPKSTTFNLSFPSINLGFIFQYQNFQFFFFQICHVMFQSFQFPSKIFKLALNNKHTCFESMSNNFNIWRFTAVACSQCWFLLTMSFSTCVWSSLIICQTLYLKNYSYGMVYLFWITLIPRVYPLRFFPPQTQEQFTSVYTVDRPRTPTFILFALQGYKSGFQALSYLSQISIRMCKLQNHLCQDFQVE